MFEKFNLQMVDLPEASLRVRFGAPGRRCYYCMAPRTHVTWHQVAPILAADQTVVCPDLRGFGQSSIPEDAADHVGSSKRAKARDCVALMNRLGFDRFAIAGHDRGSYTAFRTAMDHPSAISHLIVMDGVPILEALERCGGTGSFILSWTSLNAPSWPTLTLGMVARPKRWGLRPMPIIRERSTTRQ